MKANVITMVKTTGDVRKKVLAVWEKAENEEISNSLARTQLQAAKVILDTLRCEMTAAQLGMGFSEVILDENERRHSQRPIKSVA